jgi:hypothetical protein
MMISTGIAHSTHGTVDFSYEELHFLKRFYMADYAALQQARQQGKLYGGN